MTFHVAARIDDLGDGYNHLAAGRRRPVQRSWSGLNDNEYPPEKPPYNTWRARGLPMICSQDPEGPDRAHVGRKNFEHPRIRPKEEWVDVRGVGSHRSGTRP